MHIVLLKCPHVQMAFFEIHQLWQSGFSRVYSNCCCSCWFEPEVIKIGQSSHKMYSNNIVNFTTILNACTKKSGNLLKAPHTSQENSFFPVCIFIWPFSWTFLKTADRYTSQESVFISVLDIVIISENKISLLIIHVQIMKHFLSLEFFKLFIAY